MTQLKDSMSNIKKIRQEIERRREANKRQYLSSNGGMSWQRMCGEEDCLVELLSFIDSLPDEKSSEDLEEAAQEYAIPFNDTTYGCEYSYKGFIAGAKWQAKQLLKGSPLPEDTVLFQKGVEEGRRLKKDDLALTWEDVTILITIYEAGIDNGDYRRYNDAEWMKEYSQDILRKFNEIRKK